MQNLLKKQFIKQLVVSTVFLLLIVVAIVVSLYNHTIEDFEDRQNMVQTLIAKSFIEVAKFDKENGSSKQETLSQLFATLEHIDLENLEIVIGQMDNNILKISSYNKEKKLLQNINVAMGSKIAIPMQAAFLTKSQNHIIENDYNNNTVLAKYAYIPELDIGIVVKSEIRLIEHYLGIVIFLLMLIATIAFIFIYFMLRITHSPIENLLVKNEEKFKNIFNNSGDGILILDLQGVILEANSINSSQVGYSSEELLGKNISFLNTSAFNEKTEKDFKEILQNKNATFESEYVRKNGTIIPVEIHAKLIEYNNETAILAVIRDITERKKAETSIILAKE